jgi:hypothetical protein
MGVELHIARAECWASNEGKEITAQEWLQYVASDVELELDPRNGPHHVRWLGKSAYAQPWLDWRDANMSTKWPDTALDRKMLRVAAAPGAMVQDDEGTVYTADTDWSFDPNAKRA